MSPLTVYKIKPSSVFIRKGTTLIKKKVEVAMENGETKLRTRTLELSCDIIGDEFWLANPHLLEPFRGL
jgi:hypothetical protein